MSGYGTTRKDLRDNIRLLLLNLTSAGENVFTERVQPLFPEEVSSIVISIISDTPNRQDKIDWNYDRIIVGKIQISVRRTSSIDKPEDVADEIAGLIEDRLLPNIYMQYPPPTTIQLPGGEGDPGSEIVDNFDLQELLFAKTDEGETDVFGINMEFTAIYHYNKKQGSVVPFETANIHYDLEGEQTVADQAEDTIELPQ